MRGEIISGERIVGKDLS